MKKEILVVDDEALIRQFFTICFRREGYDAVGVESAEAALELIKTRSFNIFFLDLNLPGIDGIELCRKIRKRVQPAVIYAITGYSGDYRAAACLAAGFDRYYTKPIKLETLRKAALEAFTRLDLAERGR